MLLSGAMPSEFHDPERSPLDPSDWGALADLGRRMVSDVLGHLSTLEDEPVWRPVPDEVKRRFETPAPERGTPADAVYEEFLETVLPYNMGNVHPRFWGWVNGAGTPFTALAEFLAAGMNPNAHGSDIAPHYVERQVVEWLKEMMGFPAQASGILLSGCSVANWSALAVALNAKAEVDVAVEGLGALPRPMVLYASDQTHFSIRKAARTLGLGERALRIIPADDRMALDVDALAEAIRRDRAAGALPFFVVGNAGTVDTGAFDPLADLAALCREEGLWFHVDGAFGAAAALVPELAPKTAGMTEADSLAFDLHKWFHVPYEAGCVLVRDREAHRRTFRITADYVESLPGGIAPVEDPFRDYGPQLSRGFRALKVWMGFKHHGVGAYREAVERNVRQARHLEARIRREPELEVLAPVSLNVVCFRYVGRGADPGSLDAANRRVLIRLQESGVALPTQTRIRGRFAIRVSITNHRSHAIDFDRLVDEVLQLGRDEIPPPDP